MHPRDIVVGQQHATALALRTLQGFFTERRFIGLLLGPGVGLTVWLLPLGGEPATHKALAIVAFMVVYWIAEPIDHGLTALIGCYLFWTLQVAKPSVAFSGFADPTPWFMFGALLMGEAASGTGLAKRLGYLILYRVGTTYSRLLLGIIILVYLLNFLIPSPQAQIVIIAPLLIGLITGFALGSGSNVAKGLFITLTYTATLFGKMILSGNSSLLARGLIEEQTGLQVLWSQWLLAFLPAALLTVLACWASILWLYPPEAPEIPGGRQHLQNALQAMGPWSRGERIALGWLLLALSLWATDFLHHLHPAIIALGIGLLLTLPAVGLLEVKAVRSVNILLVIFLAGALSMGNVLTATGALTAVTNSLVSWMALVLANAFHGTLTLYWGGFLYHFLIGADSTMVSTALPVLLDVAKTQGYNPIAVGLIWSFTAGGKLFVYQASSLIVGYSYGYFEGKDLLKVGAILTLAEGIFLTVLVPVYWPLIGLPWRQEPQAALAVPPLQLARGVYVPGQADLAQPWASGAHLEVTWAQLETRPGQFDWRVIEQHPTVLQAVRVGKPFGLQIRLQGTTGQSTCPPWAQVSQVEVAGKQGPSRTWPAVWTTPFQHAFPRFIQALAQQYDGDPRLAYVVMTEGTAIPYAANPRMWDKAGYTVTRYSEAYKHMYQSYLQTFSKTPLVAAITRFGQESRQALSGHAEEQALRDLLDFAGMRGLHFLVPNVYTPLHSKSSYVRDEILLPAFRKYAAHSHLLLRLDPGEPRVAQFGNQILQAMQQRWPEVSIGAVIFAR